jgi:hypothetical protein
MLPQILVHTRARGTPPIGVLVYGPGLGINSEPAEHSSIFSSCFTATVTALSRTLVKGTSRGPVLDPTSPLGHRRLDVIGQAHAKCVT